MYVLLRYKNTSFKRLNPIEREAQMARNSKVPMMAFLGLGPHRNFHEKQSWSVRPAADDNDFEAAAAADPLLHDLATVTDGTSCCWGCCCSCLGPPDIESTCITTCCLGEHTIVFYKIEYFGRHQSNYLRMLLCFLLTRGWRYQRVVQFFVATAFAGRSRWRAPGGRCRCR